MFDTTHVKKAQPVMEVEPQYSAPVHVLIFPSFPHPRFSDGRQVQTSAVRIAQIITPRVSLVTTKQMAVRVSPQP